MESVDFLSSPLAPSEVVLLHGPQFAPPTEPGGRTAPFLDMPAISLPSLGESLLAAALLAGEQAGTLVITQGKRRILLGLFHRPTLYLQLGGTSGAWPAHSLEAQLHRQLSRGVTTPIALLPLLKGWQLPAASWLGVIEGIQQGLTARGLLQLTQTRRPGMPAQRSYLIPSPTRALASNAPWPALQTLLTRCQQDRPDLWGQLMVSLHQLFAAKG